MKTPAEIEDAVEQAFAPIVALVRMHARRSRHVERETIAEAEARAANAEREAAALRDEVRRQARALRTRREPKREVAPALQRPIKRGWQ